MGGPDGNEGNGGALAEPFGALIFLSFDFLTLWKPWDELEELLLLDEDDEEEALREGPIYTLQVTEK